MEKDTEGMEAFIEEILELPEDDQLQRMILFLEELVDAGQDSENMEYFSIIQETVAEAVATLEY